ncbi:MAG: hypothetical protein VX208_17710, partial [SAR324 cluster bacterium]|nr:hypothetical protein [SAR324 cluster bacterium]
VADAKELDQVLQGLWKSSTNFQDNSALILLKEEFQRSLGKFLTNGEQFVLLSNDGASNKSSIHRASSITAPRSRDQ